MLKTPSQIEGDFYRIARGSALGQTIRGDVYRNGMRPDNATGEDAVVAFLAGNDTNPQTGVVVLRIYVPDILFRGRKVKDIARFEELEGKVWEMIRAYRGEYYFKTEVSMTHAMHEEIGQHCLIARLEFQRITD